MPRPVPRPLHETDEATPTAKAPRRSGSDYRGPSRRPRPLEGGLRVFAVCALLVGGCGGLSAGCESVTALSGSATSQTLSVQTGETKRSVTTKPGESALAGVNGVLRLIFALASLGAAVFAGAALNKVEAFDARAFLAWSAAGLAGFRLILTWLDRMAVEEAVEQVRAVAQKSTGYSYAKIGAALESADDMGMTMMVVLGVAAALFWAIAAVAFWDSGREEE